jgi:hypothetical protein
MRVRTILGEILPVIGTVGLLGLWIFQQTKIEARSSELQRLAAGRAQYQTYQSNNAVFNAIIEPIKENKEAVDRIRTFQIYNYELGLRGIEDALPPSTKSDIPVAAGYQESARQAQVRLEELQDRLRKREETLKLEEAKAKTQYLGLYIGLSIAMVVGAILKVMEKLEEEPAVSN